VSKNPDKPIRSARKSRIVQGFGVTGQGRDRFRSDSLSGDYQGLPWMIFSESAGLFQWRIGGMAGYSGPTLAHVLGTMKRAAVSVKELRKTYGDDVPGDVMSVLAKLIKWERRALQGRLTIEGPLGKGETRFYRVREIDG